MAAFQQYSASLLLDSVIVPTIKTSGVFDEFIPYLNTFETTHKSQKNQEYSSINVSGYECSCLEQHSTNKSSLNNKKGFVSLSMADKAEYANHETQKCAHLDKKRKSPQGSSSTSANSEEVQQVMQKNQKQNTEAKKGNKVIDEPPKGYIHVRARRGQATDSHSLAERVRREKISERMKKLQALVPGCDKVTGKAFMLDEIINYVQSLQNQVEFLSMKLVSLDPTFYTFGLINRDSMLFGNQVINNGMASPMTLMQSTNNVVYSIDQPQAFTNTNALSSSTTSSATTSTYASSIVDSSTILLQQDPQQSLTPLQDAGSLCWGINELQRQNIINEFGLISGTNLYSCQ